MLSIIQWSLRSPVFVQGVARLPALRASASLGNFVDYENNRITRRELGSTDSRIMVNHILKINGLEITTESNQEYEIEEDLQRVIGDLIGENTLLFNKRTWQPSVLKRKRKHGFLSKIATHNGNKTLQRRKAKGRHRIVTI